MQDDSWVAVARWRTGAMRDRWFTEGTGAVEVSANMPAAVDRRFECLEVEVCDDRAIIGDSSYRRA